MVSSLCIVVSDDTSDGFFRIDLGGITLPLGFDGLFDGLIMGLFSGSLTSSLVLKFLGLVKKKSLYSFYLICYSACSMYLTKKLCFHPCSAFFYFLASSSRAWSSCYFSIVSSKKSISLSLYICFFFVIWLWVVDLKLELWVIFFIDRVRMTGFWSPVSLKLLYE